MKETESDEFRFYQAENNHKLETAGGDLAIMGYTFRRLRWLGTTHVVACLVVPNSFPYELLLGRRALENQWRATINFQRKTITSTLSNIVVRFREAGPTLPTHDLEKCPIYVAQVERSPHRCRDTVWSMSAEIMRAGDPQTMEEWHEMLTRLRKLAGQLQRVEDTFKRHTTQGLVADLEKLLQY
jgi:hypothetical protein